LVTGELQENVLRTRMQPISNLLNRFPRLVRDLASQCGKEVRLTMDGQDTGLDRSIMEAIKDPLTHILRNAIDHGLERPEVRLAAGKDPRGHLQIRAYHEGGQVCIEVHDDGCGIDVARVRATALERRLITEAEAPTLTDRDALQLVFRPGFSTADRVTNLSGRGVGMDVVRTSVEAVGGSVDLSTRRGLGTEVRLKIPLTLAIIPALMIVTGGQRYAIPQVNLQELVLVEASAIEFLYGAEVYRMRGQLLPVLRLRSALGLAPEPQDTVHIVVVNAGGLSFGLAVDAVLDTQDIVVKPLSRDLRQIQLYAGATIVGDGRVALILDVPGLARTCRLRPDRESAPPASEPVERRSARRQPLVLFSAGDGEQYAIPLTLVSRLEEFPAGALERVSGSLVVQYRGHLLPLVDLAELLGRAGPRGERLSVMVFNYSGRDLGLIVGEILDVVDQALELGHTGSPGVLGRAVINGRATSVLDAHHLLASARPDWFHNGSPAPSGLGQRVMLVDDSPFMSGVSASYLETAGHEVLVLARSEEALPRLMRDRFHAVVVEAACAGSLELVYALLAPGTPHRGLVVVTANRRGVAELPEGARLVHPYGRDNLLAALEVSSEPSVC
ncbi:MAG: chemotaxis protein CheW, partial [Candidatus Eremiobacterota bacterium]